MRENPSKGPERSRTSLYPRSARFCLSWTHKGKEESTKNVNAFSAIIIDLPSSSLLQWFPLLFPFCELSPENTVKFDWNLAFFLVWLWAWIQCDYTRNKQTNKKIAQSISIAQANKAKNGHLFWVSSKQTKNVHSNYDAYDSGVPIQVLIPFGFPLCSLGCSSQERISSLLFFIKSQLGAWVVVAGKSGYILPGALGSKSVCVWMGAYRLQCSIIEMVMIYFICSVRCCSVVHFQFLVCLF